MAIADGSERSYHIDTENGQFRRNRKDIQPLPQEIKDNCDIKTPEEKKVTENLTSPTKERIRNPERYRKAPSHFKDFVK